MKLSLASLILLLTTTTCVCQTERPSSPQIDRASGLETPSKAYLDSVCIIDAEKLQRVQKSSSEDCDRYYLDGNPFTGWACSILSDNQHKFRYELFEEGKMTWRIGYYDNGQRDADFRLEDCKNYGPSRMWHRDGSMYLDQFFSSPGVPHGNHKRWHQNNALAWEAQYKYGDLLYEKHYNPEGIEIKQ